MVENELPVDKNEILCLPESQASESQERGASYSL